MIFEHVSAARCFVALTAALALACGPAPAPTPASTPAPTANAEPPHPPERPAPPVRKDGTVYAETEQMGTRVSINLWIGEHTAAQAGAAIEAAFAEIERIEQIMSEWRPDSELSQLNDNAGGPLKPLSPELFEILQRSKLVAEATGGAFDPTFYAVGQLWHFEPGARPPAPETIAEKLALVGWRDIELDPNTGAGRLARPGMKVGLGAIAKGYAVDRASQVLLQHGFGHHIVEGGGDTYVSGSKGGTPWKVGIQRPDRPGSLAAIPATDRAIVTSGGYQRFIEIDGKRYAHILDPRTGWPLDEAASAQSVTLVAANATDADAYATAVAVMGPEQGMAFVEAHPALEAVLLTRSGELLVSKDLRPILVLPPAEADKPPAPDVR
ncbi:MAG: FAD:protein FMN transferase [Nannocystis sp.]|nr:FAD:protein FMN transferase [Nannocystis sp.]MBA3547290.1 FAD:protein FMN transferase [Nannocystis sp.]